MQQLGFNLDLPITVSELTRKIKSTLETSFHDVWVQGEITGLRIPSSGHLYFSLKDADAQIKVVFFRSGNRFLKFKPVDGMEVVVRGRMTVYDSRGEYQIVAEFMEQKGLGALQLAFMLLKEKLEREGLFDQSRKRPLPHYPKRIGIVTSPTGAAIRDIFNIMKRRAPSVSLVVAAASVQGELAPPEIAQGLRDLNELGGLDAIIVGRGGGSMEDLAAFNTEVVARAIYSSRVPVISAVGHETDFTIADFVADLRAPTPSAAAELVATHEQQLRERLYDYKNRVSSLMSRELRMLRTRLDSESRAISDPRRLVQDRQMRLDDIKARLISSQTKRVKDYTTQQTALSRLLASFEPLKPLSRGFAIARKHPGMDIIKSTGQLAPGDSFTLVLADGEIESIVSSPSNGGVS